MSFDFSSPNLPDPDNEPEVSQPEGAPWPTSSQSGHAQYGAQATTPGAEYGGQSGPSTGPVGGTTSAPVALLAGGLVLAVLAAVAHLIVGSFAVAIVGWAVGGPAVIALFAWFISSDGRRRAHPFYRVSGAVDAGRRLLVVLALVAVTVNAWWIADHIARSGRFS